MDNLKVYPYKVKKLMIRFTKHAELKFELLEAHGFNVTKMQVEEAVTMSEKTIAGRRGRLVA